MIYTGYVLGGNKDIKDYFLEIYWRAASNLKMSFFPKKVWMAASLKPVYFLLTIIVLLFVRLNPVTSKVKTPNPSSLGFYTFLRKNKYLWSKT